MATESFGDCLSRTGWKDNVDRCPEQSSVDNLCFSLISRVTARESLALRCQRIWSTRGLEAFCQKIPFLSLQCGNVR
jgi:hypothetical protein